MRNNLKNPHYKSTLQFYNSTSQQIATTNTITNPVIATILGNKVTDTGVAISADTQNIYIENAGTYEADVNIVADVTTAGTLYFALTLNGTVLPETITSGALEIGENFIDLHTVRFINRCCDNSIIDVIAYSDGTGVANITKLSGSVVKLA